MINKEDFNLEDAIFDSFAKDYDKIEMPLARSAFLLVGGLIAASAIIAVGQMVILNIGQGDRFQERASANVNEEMILPAYRGIISDRFGEPLVKNSASFSVFLNLPELIRSTGNSAEKNISIIQTLSDILSLDFESFKKKIRNFDLEKQSVLLVADGIGSNDLIGLQDLKLPGVTVKEGYAREYPDGPIFAHILGYHGQVQTGLEAIYDRYLKGEDGRLIIFEDARGRPLDKKIVSGPIAGNQLITAIDANLQRFFYKRLSGGLRALGRDTGVGIAMDPQTGEILSLISLPSFNNNLFAAARLREEKAGVLNSPAKPLFNRAVSGVYAPGSAIKPLVALGALLEGVVTPDTSVFSKGFIEIPNPYYPDQPSRFLDWKPHGLINLYSALARSSNIYFYAIGGGLDGIKGLGIEKLRDYWSRFLLGQPTGIDLPAEATGFLPDPEEKEQRTGQIWRIGDTYNVSIGQGDLLLTPIQLLNFIAAIANDGVIYKPYVVKEAVSADGSVTALNQPTALLNFQEWQKEIEEVQRGMEDAVQKWYGTANLLSSLPVSAAGKTGSAQVANNTRTNAFFVGYLPADDPKIAILVLIENAREGSLNAVPIAKDVLEWYYYNRLTNLESRN